MSGPQRLKPLQLAWTCTAEEVFAELLDLPATLRRGLYLLIQEHADSFNGVPYAKHTKVHSPTGAR
jgi:hypothetical protein